MLMALLLIALFGVLPGQEKSRSDVKPPRRGDAVVARGCLSGRAFDSSEVSGRDKNENETRYAEFVTFRLTGDKKLLEEIREHSGHADVLRGELGTDLPKARSSSGITVGNSRIGIGVSRGMAPEPPPPLPVLKVTAFEHTGVTCR